MPQDRRRHAAPGRRIATWQRWNRGDLAILCCGVLTFLSFTAGAPLFHEAPLLTVPGIHASAPGVRAAAAPAGAAPPMAEPGIPRPPGTAPPHPHPVVNPAPEA